ncbi:MAG TPA: hypothetical protein VFA25_06045 [Actinomycetota bacterium]|jgi:hypothetical protein|nr:hypothetical protein [Actinomycetota bacterium]
MEQVGGDRDMDQDEEQQGGMGGDQGGMGGDQGGMGGDQDEDAEEEDKTQGM